MDDLHLVWLGGRGVGKKTSLHKALAHVATGRGVTFSIKKGIWSTEPPKKLARESQATEPEENEIETPQQGEGIPYEMSIVHLGFDVARMSMQDKNYIASLLNRLGYGTEVAVGKKKTIVKRILVLYHAHLLSHDSILQLQMALEQYEGSITLWFTSELPLPHELADWFVEVPLSGQDMLLQQIKSKYGNECLDWSQYFQSLVQSWSSKEMTIHRITEIRDWVYYCLQRNLRWQEVIQYLLEAILQSNSISLQKKSLAIDVLAKQPTTGGGQTLPSYRIPIAWEALGLGLAEALAIDSSAKV